MAGKQRLSQHAKNLRHARPAKRGGSHLLEQHALQTKASSAPPRCARSIPKHSRHRCLRLGRSQVVGKQRLSQHAENLRYARPAKRGGSHLLEQHALRTKASFFRVFARLMLRAGTGRLALASSRDASMDGGAEIGNSGRRGLYRADQLARAAVRALSSHLTSPVPLSVRQSWLSRARRTHSQALHPAPGCAWAWPRWPEANAG